jgi:hypothetical protein
VHRRALERGLELAGGIEPLARYLSVAPASVHYWLSGASPVPGDVFLKLVDLIIERSMSELQPPGAK